MVVIEVLADRAVDHRTFRHTVPFERVRLDLEPEPMPIVD